MSWFRKEEPPLIPKLKEKERPDLWVRCKNCQEIIYRLEIERNLDVCPKCNYHFQIPAEKRLSLIVDEGTFEEIDKNLSSVDILKFKDTKKYSDRIKDAQKKIGKKDAFVSGKARIGGYPVFIGIFEFKFMGGSLGSVVGEKVTRLVENSMENKTPLLIFTASGGARMQEGVFSLMQMAKTSAAIARLKNMGVPYITVLTDPTTGGVSASFAMLGDIILAEPKAMIGFAGPRVIKETIKAELPPGFQRAEYLLEHGMIDRIVPRQEMKKTLILLLDLLSH
ncbi:MAG: acetyl-CoA carboxylase carboxyltransferase subunit beta [Deltaproteobacteria bacterium]|nr:acetyl-CoA carboxylase carboxyltransferase subunit beta [Deltaproteobacteria bacterium]